MITDFKKAIRTNIERVGQHIQGVFPLAGEDGVCFFYTVGNADRGLPELLLIGNLPQHIAVVALNEVGQYMRERGKQPAEGLLDIGWSFPFKIRHAGGDVRAKYTFQAGQYLGHEGYDVLQVMVCDKEGRYPGDKDCQLDVDRP
jgi:hypothetical protein